MLVKRIAAPLALLVVLSLGLALLAAGCGGDGSATLPDDTEGRPEKVTAYEAVQYTRPAADKWQDKNWMIQVRDGDPDGIDREGRARIWEVYYFSPTPEEDCQFLVIYNRGRVWPSVPTVNKGGDEGKKIFEKLKPEDFRVDSGEAYGVSLRNGGSQFQKDHPDSQVHVTLRCRADYDAVGEAMPAPKYKWIWDVTYREPAAGSEELHVFVDGMNGDYISKETTNQP